MTVDLTGKIALVTGGARGIGKGISTQLAKAGAAVAIHARMPSADGDAFAAALAHEHGVQVRVITGDFLDPTSIAPLFDAFDQAFESIDILINNAGFEVAEAAEAIALPDWQAVLAVNLTAPFLCSQQAARRMIERKRGGVIVNISSIHDTVPRKGMSSYCASKGGLLMMARTTALEWAEYGIRVLTISPGAIETDMNREVIEEFGREKFNAWIPLGRIGNIGDIAQLVAFLCSDEASYITGTEITVDGGFLRNLVRYDDRPQRRSATTAT